MEDRPHSAAESSHLPPHSLSHRRADEFNAQEEDEEMAEELEEELTEMAHKLLNYRSTLPDQLISCLSALLSAQRPQFSLSDWDSESDAGSHGESCEGLIAAVEDQETINGISLLKEKISNNVSAMPLVLRRMNECISRISKLSSCSDIGHPALKRAEKTRQHNFS